MELYRSCLVIDRSDTGRIGVVHDSSIVLYLTVWYDEVHARSYIATVETKLIDIGMVAAFITQREAHMQTLVVEVRPRYASDGSARW